MIGPRVAWIVTALASVAAGAPLAGQATSLAEAADRARTAWRGQDAQALVAGSQTVQLQIPGAAPSSPLGRDQAAVLLARYFQGVEERELILVAVRALGADRGYAELERHYAVPRTRDERCESVFLGFRRVGGRWVLAEVRIGP